jgi:adenine-specific DNA-methyltransferase
MAQARRFICIQLPERITADTEAGRNALAAGFHTIADICNERVRRIINKLNAEDTSKLDLESVKQQDRGFRVFKLDSSNIRAWEPDRDNLPQTLLNAAENLKRDRSEQDILCELLLKLGLDLTVPIETHTISGKVVHSIGAGVLLVCLAGQIAPAEAETLAHGIADWHRQLDPAGESQVVFRDSAFADDVAKTNLAAILQQNGLENVRSL